MAILPLAFLTPGLHNGRSNAKEAGMTDNGEEALRERLAGLRLAHGDLDSAISSLELRGPDHVICVRKNAVSSRGFAIRRQSGDIFFYS